MRITSRLAAVLRARKVQEDVSRGVVAKANIDRALARSRSQDRAESMETWSALSAGDGTAFVASMAAGRALAGALHQARLTERAANGEVELSTDRLRGAARRRLSTEKLVERAADAQRRDELAAEQRVVDDLTTGPRPGTRP